MNKLIPNSIFILAFIVSPLSGQVTTSELSGKINAVTTAVPFLTIPVGAFTNSGISTVPNGTLEPTIFGNIGLVGFEKKKFGISVSYTPWLRKLVPDINLFGLGFYYRINKRSTIGFGLRYFGLGNLTFTNIVGNSTHTFKPYEFSPSASYVINFDELTSLGIGCEFIYSNLTGGANVGGIKSHPGIALAGNLGFSKKFLGNDDRFSHMIGVSLNHIGSKISYTKNSRKDFIPTTLAIGYQFKTEFDDWSIALSYEVSKLLVPSPPLYFADSVGVNGDPVIKSGYDPNVSVPLGMIRSFYDAPSGFSEEMKEIVHQIGFMAQFHEFTAGLGFFYEDGTKGNRKFFTLGVGVNLKDQVRINCSYLLPMNNQNSPLANTFGFGVNVLF